MTTHLRRLQSGDPLSAGPGSAAAWSEMVDVARSVERIKRVGPNEAGVPKFCGGSMVQIRNGSGAARDRFDVLAVTDSILDPAYSLGAFQSKVFLEGDVPATPTDYGKFVVLAQPLADNKIGWAWASGICVVEVDYTYSGQPYADIKDADAGLLLAGEGGAAQVIWKESGTGTIWSVVRIGTPYYPILRGKLDADLTQASGSATMSIWEGATLADSTRNVTVYDPGAITSGKKIASGAGLSASWTSGKWWMLTPYVCETS